MKNGNKENTTTSAVGYVEVDDWEDGLKEYYKNPCNEIDEILCLDDILKGNCFLNSFSI